MDYVLVTDECDHCRYVSNAFTLLGLPLRALSIKDLNQAALHDTTIAVLVCNTIENEHAKQIYKVINSSDAHLISMNEPNQQHATMNMSVHYLKTNFSKFELNNALANTANKQENHSIHEDLMVLDRLVGKSEQICKIKSLIKQVAYSDTTILILGQSGTGKDVIASCIHQLSDRKHHPLVPINCGAIPSELIESELFGHEKGAFTGALTRRPGRFEIAHTGTLFLDEIGDMPLHMQVKLLRVLQERKIERVGGNISIDVDVRLIAATNKNLEDLIAENRFREDLYYRINVFPIDVPSLNERQEDIPLLIDYHLDKIYDRLKHRVEFTARAMKTLCAYAWPGNIRELQNFIERMVILFPDQVLDEKDFELGHKPKRRKSSFSENAPIQLTLA